MGASELCTEVGGICGEAEAVYQNLYGHHVSNPEEKNGLGGIPNHFVSKAAELENIIIGISETFPDISDIELQEA